MSTGPEKVRTLPVRDAFLAWVRLYGVSELTLSDKFSGDHTLERLSSSQAAEHAVQRFVKNRNTRSTWMDASKETLINKVKGAINNATYHATRSGTPDNVFLFLRPSVYHGAQQLAACVKCSIRTVVVSDVSRDEAMRGANKNRHHEVRVNNTTHYLLCKSSEEDEKFWIMGAWSPLSSSFNLYHYQSHTPTPDIEMTPGYCRWSVDSTNVPFFPKAKK